MALRGIFDGRSQKVMPLGGRMGIQAGTGLAGKGSRELSGMMKRSIPSLKQMELNTYNSSMLIILQ